MAHRFQVIEAHPDGKGVILQALNIHASISGAFAHYTSSSCLYLLDIRTQETYTWSQCQSLAVWENLKWVASGKRIQSIWRDILIAGEFLTQSEQITDKGIELWKQIEPYPAQEIFLSKIKSVSRLMGNP